MVLSGTASPGPERSGPGSQTPSPALLTTLGTAVRLTWPSVVTALAIFVSLQVTRITLWNRVRSELRSNSPHSMHPTDIAHFAGWWSNANQLALREYRPVSWTGVVYRHIHDQPIATVQFMAGCLGASYVLALAIVTLIAVRGTRSRIVPFELTWRDRLTVASDAAHSAAPWCAVVAALAAAVCWHTGYDRLGRSRLLIDVLPSPMQGCAIMAIWAACAIVLILFFLAPPAHRLGVAETRVCPRCRYSLRGLPDRRCPECGREPSPRDVAPKATAIERHIRLLRFLPFVIVALIFIAIALTWGNSRLANWVRLRPATIPWVLTPDNCVLSEAPVFLKTIYGQVSLCARRERGVETRDWFVAWERHDGTTIREGSVYKEFQVSLRTARTPATAVMLQTPSGPIWLWQPTDNGPVYFGHPEQIVIGQ